MSFSPARSRSPAASEPEVVVIGAGFGGLAAGLRLAEAGVRVAVCETLKYPGGCASTFEHRGYQFEAGATLFSGFGEGQLFRQWIDRHGLEVEIDWLDPVVSLRTPEFVLDIPPDRAAFRRNLLALPGAPGERLDAFLAFQTRVADRLWQVLDDPDLLPPFRPRALLHHARRLPLDVGLARWIGRPLSALVDHFGLSGWPPLRVYLDALCQITVQCPSSEAEALFALGTMDYYFRGTGHVRGGIGRLAWALAGAIEAQGGSVRFLHRVRAVHRAGNRFEVVTRRGVLRPRAVVANLLPQALEAMIDEDLGLARRRAQVEDGWGAAMLYRVVPEPPGDPSAHHLELVQDPGRPFLEGNHLFCSLSGARDEGRAPVGHRTLTVSTHVPMRRLLAKSKDERALYVAEIQATMRRGVQRFAPQWSEQAADFATTASPRTFQRFVGRPEGFVGGVPRRAGLRHYLDVWPAEPRPGLVLVGDSVFPGQSTLAVALGGIKAAERVLRRL
ncbi:MAG: NAD(P)/FAD-dependent oxidoreductase [Acidobacteriota bacterium]